MPRRVAVYNGDNNALEEVLVAARRKEGAGGGPVGGVLRVLPSMTTSESSDSSLAMAVELDHMYIGCSDSKASIEKDIEVQQLKNLLLLHLDLIQQQAEQLVAKEKQIKNLRDENDNLRAKIERLDRRVSLSLQKKPSEASTNTESEPDIILPEALPFKHDETEATPVENSECPTTTLGSLLNKTPSVPASLASKATSPTAIVTAVSPPSNKPSSPSSTTQPFLKAPSPTSNKSISPVSKCVSPTCKVRSPSNKTVSSVSKPSSPTSQSESPNRTSEFNNKLPSPSSPLEPLDIKSEPPARDTSLSKPGSPTNKNLSTKPLSPSNKAVSPSNRGSLSNKVSSPPHKPNSPANKPPGEPASPPNKVVSPVSRPIPSPNKVVNSSIPGRVESLKRTSPKIASPKTSPRERYPRGETTECNLTDNESLTELTQVLRKDATRGSEKREKHTLKRRLESEGEGEVVAKRTRSEDSSDPTTGPTDHNLRSRDKPKERVKEAVVHHSPVPSSDRPCTPNSRAAALEAKKLRQKLLLKGQPPSGRSVRGDGILNTSIAYYLPYGSLRRDPNPEEECLQAHVEIPQWGTRILTSLYVMEGTENLEDEVFLKRHAKPEQDEKRRKRWDLQRMREQRHYERLRERYEGRQNTSEPEASVGHRSLWPNPESAQYLLVDDFLPVCAFGQPMARIPPQEFSLPWLSGRSQEGISTRRRKRP